MYNLADINNVNHDIPNLQVVALDRRWSDHNPLLIHSKKFDFGPTPFRIFHSWFDRIDFKKVVKDKWDDITREVLGHTKYLHTKLKDLKSHLKIWYSYTKEVETSRMNLLFADMRNLDQKTDEGLASDEDKSSRISKLQELDYFKKMNSLDLMQKARVKWEVEVDENSKFFYGLINSKRKSQSIHGIMHEGVWLSDPKDIKEAFLNFYNKKFSCHDSQVFFPSFMPAHRLNTSDQDLLEVVVSMEETRRRFGIVAVIKLQVQTATRSYSLKDFGIFQSTIFRSLLLVSSFRANSLKVLIPPSVHSSLSLEQSAFISGRQILDGPLILSKIIDWYKKRKKKLMLFKVDFEKAFDSVSWKYLDYMLHKLGFGSRWRTWINNYLMSARTSILIDGSPTSKFSLKQVKLSTWLHVPVVKQILIDRFKARLSGWKANLLSIGDRLTLIKSILIDRFKARLSGWKTNLLSIGGRLTLIKSVLGSLGVYYFSIFKAPEMVIKSLEILRANFFCGSHENSKKLSWVKWSNTLASFDKGGLGIDLVGCQTSGTWAKIMGTINHLHSSGIVPLNSIHLKVGDGSSIRFWKNTWLGNDPFYIRYNRLFHLENDKDCLFSQRILNGSWEWDWCRPITMGRSKIEFDNLIIDISNMEINDLVESDTCVWSLSNDDSFSVNSVRKHIDEHSLPSLFSCTRWYKMIPKK
nr:RNA-directed DNA polymerase, eukaryota, reverse transcriptase zinc-binding domain protein [Tanacetum cinerariifolium]